jgi:hypothetical protein
MMNRLLKKHDLYFLIITNIDGYDYSLKVMFDVLN